MRKRLYRSRKDTMIAGVAAGMAEFFHLDPTVIRLAWILLFFAGPGLPAYVVAALIIPVEPAGVRPGAPVASGSGTASGAEGAGDGAPAGDGVDGEGDTSSGTVDDGAREAEPVHHDSGRAFGWILVAIGVLFLLQRYTWIRWDRLWPVALILLGAYLIVGRARGHR